MYTITQSRLLYVMSINDRKHSGLLKIGEVFVDNEVADSNNEQVQQRIVREILSKRPYMQGITFNIEYIESTTYNQSTACYKADDVYRKLAEMDCHAIPLAKLNKEEADFWFPCGLLDIQQAIREIKLGNSAGYGKIKFRPEQKAAIKATTEHFKKEKGKSFLWNAKMRFGKTLSGLQVAKEMDYKSTLIITHRPVVDKGWKDDFNKIFRNKEDLEKYSAIGIDPVYGRRMLDEKDSHGDFYTLTKGVDEGKNILVFFVSMQYLRLSQYVGGKEKNFDPLKKAIMEYDWDFVMVDEAHEGIEAAAGIRVMNKLKKEKTRILSLSGTPFNLLDKYEEGEIYTWDYVMEQRAKQKWDEEHYGDPNPYAELPRMQILTFTLPKMLRDEAIENNEIFRFHEFFRVWSEEDKRKIQTLIENESDKEKKSHLTSLLNNIKVDNFIHEGAVKRFLDKLVEESESSRYPFSNDTFREHFRHTFWLLPGVKEAAALERMLKAHDVFGIENGMFHIINAAGDGNIEDKNGSALADVEDNIRGNAQKNISKKEYTITLSCGKLTTGVSVPEWTAVLCMKGSENTPAANYMQTIFRVQTHAVLEGRQKSDCYVFDFAPDRALTAVAETAKMAVYAQTDSGKKRMKLTQKKEEEHLNAFIKLCPVLSMDEGEMGKHFTANQIFEKLSNVYIERAVRSGYADNSLYNPDQLMNLTPEQEKALGDVHDLLGSMPNAWKPEKININNSGLGSIEGADQVKYVYNLSSSDIEPQTPSTSNNFDANGCPTTDDEGWSDVMCAPTAHFPYLYVSNSRLIDGEWTSFAKPVLWKKWEDKEANTDEARRKRDAENKEKRARMSVLRGVAIRIPLLVYGAEINDDEGEEITIDNFASDEIVDNASWEEFMPKGFTKETFNILKDCFDRSIFTGAAKRIRQLVKEADNLSTEDRIAKIATIFSYFHNPDKETVLTPWKVVNMHLSDCLGGWCFFNEEFDAPYTIENKYGEFVNAARFVNKGEITSDVFMDYNARILEINSKTGLYPLYMAYSIFKGAKEPGFRSEMLTGERGKSQNAEQYERQAGDDLEIWKDVLQDNIFVVCRTKMAVSITKRTLAGFRKDINMNVCCYEKEIDVNDIISAGIMKASDSGVNKVGKKYYYNGDKSILCDLINILRAKPEIFETDVVRGRDFWQVYNSIPRKNDEDINNMKFSAIVGNPPYQIMDGGNGASSKPVYNYFVSAGKRINPTYLSMIMPARWYAGGKGLDDFREDMLQDDSIQHLVDFVNSADCFAGVNIAGGLCYFLRNKDYHGDCTVENRSNNNALSVTTRKLNEYDVFVRSNIAVNLLKKITANNEKYMSDNVFSRNAFGLPSNARGEEFMKDGYFTLYSSDGVSYIHPDNIPTNKLELAREKYKVIVTYAMSGGNKPSSSGDYQILSSLSVLGKDEVCTETFLIIDTFDDLNQAQNLVSYMKTKFLRFLMLQALSSIHITKNSFQFVPSQDYSRSWSDDELYKKYDLNSDEIGYIEQIIKTMD